MPVPSATVAIALWPFLLLSLGKQNTQCESALLAPILNLCKLVAMQLCALLFFFPSLSGHHYFCVFCFLFDVMKQHEFQNIKLPQNTMAT